MGAAARPVRTKRPSRRAADAAAGGQILPLSTRAAPTKRPGRSANAAAHQAEAPAVVGLAEAAATRSASHICGAKRRRTSQIPSTPRRARAKKETSGSHPLRLDPCSNRGGKRAGSKLQQVLPDAKRARSSDLPCRPPDNDNRRDCASNNLLDYGPAWLNADPCHGDLPCPRDNNIWREWDNNLLDDDLPAVLASDIDRPPCPPDNNIWRDWANLADGPAGLVAERVLAYDVADYVRFRAVCRPWRQSSTEPCSHSGLDRRFHPWRWTMLRDELAVPDRRSFLNSSTGECVQVDIPELRDHDLLAVTPEGLLVLLHDRKHIRLLNPLTRHITELPPITTLVHPRNHRRLLEQNPHFNDCFAAWGSGVADDDDTFVLCFSQLCMLGMAKPGDNHWTVLEYHIDGTANAPLMFAGRFYCVARNAVKVLVTDPDMPRLEVAAKLKNMHVSPIGDSVHLVNNCGELMLVHRHSGPLTAGNKSGRWFDTYKVDLDTGTLLPVKSLGGAGRAIFMGMYCSLSLSLEVFPSGSISADTIYLSFDFSERDLLQIGGYHLADGSVELPCSLVPRPHTLVDCLSLSNTVVDDS